MNPKIKKHIFAVVMAGGGGTRLWPASRLKHPKHVLQLIGDRTLFQRTIDRLKGFIPNDQIIVVTTADQVELLREQVSGLLPENMLIEPAPRGTASVVGLSAVALLKRDPDAIMMVLPSDHFIKNRRAFHTIMKEASEVAQDGYLVTIGISPSYPATGYGYIQKSGSLPKKFGLPVFEVLRFTEKPNAQTAKKMLESGEYFWNSGMFVWRADKIMENINTLMPELNLRLRKIDASWGTAKQDAVLQSEWLGIVPQTIDYGIMEHARDVAVLPAEDLHWSDVGSWDSLYDVSTRDENGNAAVNTDHKAIDSYNSLILTSENKLVVTLGVKDLVIIDTGDSLLICNRHNAQDVRKVIDWLKSEKKNQYL